MAVTSVKRIAVTVAAVGAATVAITLGESASVTPVASGWPDATNTGIPAGRTLTTVNADVTLSTPGQVYQDKIVNGCITVSANNVTIRYVRVQGDCGIGICTGMAAVCSTGSDNTGLVVEDSEIDCGGNIDFAEGRTAISPQNYTATRVRVYGGCENGLWADANVTIQDSLIHEIIRCDFDGSCSEPAPHTDGVQIPGGASNISIVHNTIEGQYLSQTVFGNSGITMGGATVNLTVQNNLLRGGGYAIRCEGAGARTNTSVIDNHFSTTFVSTVGGSGPVSGCPPPGDGTWPPANTYSGNVYHDGPDAGNPVP